MSDRPVCFGSVDDYSPKDAACRACSYRPECSRAVGKVGK